MIDRCVCFNITFEELKNIAEEREIVDIEDLKDVVKCAMKCRLCEDYIIEMLRTGKTEF